MAPSVHAYTAAMRAASEGGRWEAALAIWEDMQQAGCKPTGALLPLPLAARLPLAAGDSKQRCWAAWCGCATGVAAATTLIIPSSAAGLASQQSSYTPHAAHPCSPFHPPAPPPPSSPAAGHAFAAVISACAAGGQWQRAVSLFDEMLAWGVRPDVVSCTALITALGTDGQWERAEKVLEWMQRSDIKPNVRTLTALITGEDRQQGGAAQSPATCTHCLPALMCPAPAFGRACSGG